MSASDQEVNPPVAGEIEIDPDHHDLNGNFDLEPQPDTESCVRCKKYEAEQRIEESINGEAFNLTMFRLKCWAKDLNDILLDVQTDEIPHDDVGSMRDYVYSINDALYSYFMAYRYIFYNIYFKYTQVCLASITFITGLYICTNHMYSVHMYYKLRLIII